MKTKPVGPRVAVGFVVCLAAVAASAKTAEPALSQNTQACLECHRLFTPGIVADWKLSRHAQTTPAAALAKPALERRVSSENIPAALQKTAVGCFECHGQNPEAHPDTFAHFGYQIHPVVSPEDCKTCHAREVAEFSGSKKAHAVDNLMDNPVYALLVETIMSPKEIVDGKTRAGKASEDSKGEACLACHGTVVKVKGMKKIETALGQIEVPDLTNWPNDGVGRVNPDGSRGGCGACHPRHGFSIEVARKPYNCARCHLEPDVPGWNVWAESVHGFLTQSQGDRYDWDAVPWTVGQDFRAPSCAVCHNALVVNPQGDVLAPRTHDFGARLWVRLFGLPYATAQPKSGRTSIIKNADGLPLPATFGNVPAADYLIDQAEQDRRRAAMVKLCTGCHGTDWSQKQFEQMDTVIEETNRMTLAATQLVSRAWEKGKADKTNPFDEKIEQMWVKQWLFYGSTTRYAAAMSGPDYSAFKNGWWDLTHNLESLEKGHK